MSVDFTDLFESRTIVHGQVLGLVALDQVLWFFVRGVDSVSLERDCRGNFFLNRASEKLRRGSKPLCRSQPDRPARMPALGHLGHQESLGPDPHLQRLSGLAFDSVVRAKPFGPAITPGSISFFVCGSIFFWLIASRNC